MKNFIKHLLRENIQQADKVYFKDGKLSPEVRAKILDITNGDPYTKLVTDLYFYFSRGGTENQHDEHVYKVCDEFHNDLINYNKNVMPLVGNLLDYSAQKDRPFHISDIYSCLGYRRAAVRRLKELPSVVVRNLKQEISEPSNQEYHFEGIARQLKKLVDAIDGLPRDNDKREEYINKIAASNNSLTMMVDVAEHFLFTVNQYGQEMDREDVLYILEDINAKVLQDSKGLLVIQVNDAYAMTQVGCTSTWCFARPNDESWWEQYAPEGFVIVIYDFKLDYNDAKHLMVYLPSEDQIYVSTNVPIEQVGIDEPDVYLRNIGVDFKKIADAQAPQPKGKKKKRVDPNQLALDLHENIKKILRENS